MSSSGHIVKLLTDNGQCTIKYTLSVNVIKLNKIT